MIALSAVTTTRQQLLVPHQQLDHLIFGRRISVGEAQLRHRLSPHEVGDGSSSLAMMAPGWRVGRRLQVQHDVGLDAQLLGNAHGIAGRVSIGVVVDGDLAHGPQRTLPATA
jgi:hypothetical protein